MGRFLAVLALTIAMVWQGARPAHAQTAREQAVAIDAVPAPPSDAARLSLIAASLRFPWSMAFLPDGAMLIVEKHHGVRIRAQNGALSDLLTGVPDNVLTLSDSGFLDIALDPEFAQNRFVYLAFVEGSEDANRTAIWKARFDGDGLVDGRVLFRTHPSKKGPSHPGGRLLFLKDKTLLLTVGDGYDYRDAAQDMRSHLGKIVRLTRDGVAARDNPFIGKSDVAPEIWTSGHRNNQGLFLDQETGEVWTHEHGPRGGDEVNLLRAGANYGWPRVSFGIDYDGKLISERLSAPEYEAPKFFWSPSIAPSGMALYRGGRYPEYAGKLFVGGLASRSLVRLRLGRQTNLFVEDERMFSALKARIRDVRVGPDGLIYLLTDEETNARLMRIEPQSGAAPNPRGLSTRDLDFWLGKWEGQAQFKPAFTQDAKEIDEAVKAYCNPVLAGNYIQCDVTFTRPDGRARGVMWLWNFNEVSGSYEGMTLASNYGQETPFQMRWDEAGNSYVALLPTRTADNRAATEKLVFEVSRDRRTVRGLELIRPNEGDNSDWVTTFEYTLRKLD